MRTAEEIQKLVLEDNTENLNLLEMQLFLDIKRLLAMYHNRQISSEQAKNFKTIAIKEYETNIKQYEFQERIYKEHVENIKKTEDLRIKLRKQLNANTELADIVNTSIELIQLYSGEQFI